MCREVENVPRKDDNREYSEQPSQVRIAALRRARRYEIIAIVAVAIMLLSFLLYFMFLRNSTAGIRNRCWEQQKAVEQLAAEYVTSNGLSSYPAYISDIPTIGEREITCPDGGTYVWNPIEGTYSCTKHGHYPNGYEAPQSTVQNVVETPIETDEDS